MIHVHKTEEFMEAFYDVLRLAMPEITVTRDDPFLTETDTKEHVNITQGDEVYLDQNMKYTDTLLTVNVDIKVVQRLAAKPIGTLVNARRAAIVQALAPTQNGSDSLGVSGAYQMLEGDSLSVVTDAADRVIGDIRMLWSVNLRRNVDDPTQFN